MTWGTAIERFEAKVDKLTDDCWRWTGARKAAGYGQFMADGRKVIAHRWAYGNFVGPIPEGYEIDHLCRNRSCVNPAHLEAITLQENRRRRNEAKTHCVNGHRYTEESTYWWTGRDGYRSRRCRTCNAASALRAYRRPKNRADSTRP